MNKEQYITKLNEIWFELISLDYPNSYVEAIKYAIKCKEQWAKKVLGETEYYDEEAQEKAEEVLEIIWKYTNGE